MIISNKKLFRGWWLSFFFSVGSFSVLLLLLVFIHSILLRGSLSRSFLFSLPLDVVIITLGVMSFFFGFLSAVFLLFIHRRVVKVIRKKSIIRILKEKYGRRYVLKMFSFPVIIVIVMVLVRIMLNIDVLTTKWVPGIELILLLFFLFSLFNLFHPLMRECSLILKSEES
jgi:ribose/xylose/arabinose/galactoside ABC-type transport system permease subunit